MIKRILIVGIVVFIGTIVSVTGSAIADRVELTDGCAKSIKIPKGHGFPNIRYTILLKNKTGNEIHDLEIESESMNVFNILEIVYIDVHCGDIKMQDDNDVKRVHYYVNEDGRVVRDEENVEDSDPNEDGVDSLHVGEEGGETKDEYAYSKNVESNFYDGIQDNEDFEVTIELEAPTDEWKRDRYICLKPTSAGGGFFCNSYIVKDSLVYITPDSVGQSIPNIHLCEDSAAVFAQDTVITISPLTPNWEFSGTPSATVTAGDLNIGTSYILGGEIQVPVIQQSTLSSVITLSDVTVDAGDLPDSAIVALADVPGGCADEFVVGQRYYEKQRIVPALTGITMLILIFLLMITSAYVLICRVHH